MKLEELSLKADSLLRRAGLAEIPRSALLGLIAIGLVIILLGAWHFWPHPSGDFIANAGAATQEENTDTPPEEFAQQSNQIVVDVEGAITNPGVYTLPEDSRAGDAIEAAGGLTKDAAAGSINLAQKISDGEQIIVLTKDEMQNGGNVASGSSSSQNTSAGQANNGKININTANAEELQKLSGVGPSLSERIIQYRESNGKFSSIEDLKNVSGIGDTRFANIKDMICV